PLDRALASELLQRIDRVRRDERHVGVAGEQALDLLKPDLTAADDEAAPALQPQAGDVERRLEHPLDAFLVADALLQLAGALRADVGLGWHCLPRVLTAIWGGW